MADADSEREPRIWKRMRYRVFYYAIFTLLTILAALAILRGDLGYSVGGLLGITWLIAIPLIIKKYRPKWFLV